MPVVGNEELYDVSGLNETPGFFSADTLNDIPGVLVGTGINIGRVNKTITRGTRLSRRGQSMAGTGMGGFFKGGISQTFNPARARRFSRGANIDNSFYGKKSGIYTPFNALSSGGNWMFNRFSGAASKSADSRLGKMVGAAGGPGTKGEQIFSPGTLGRMSTLNKISGMSDKKFLKAMPNISNAIRDINPTAFKGMMEGVGELSTAAAKGQHMAGLANTITGRISGRAAGFVQGAELFTGSGANAAAMETFDAMRAGVTGSRSVGFEAGAKAAGWGEKGATTAGKLVGRGAVSGALRGLNAAGWILLAHDAAALTGKAIAGTVRLGIDAMKSVQGSINKDIMGMGFRDNQVSATSRQRGVMAISNSQLNMRSALGSEASQMYSRFG